MSSYFVIMAKCKIGNDPLGGHRVPQSNSRHATMDEARKYVAGCKEQCSRCGQDAVAFEIVTARSVTI